MSRSEAVRQQVLELDDYRCQITGADRREGVVLHVHHVHRLGAGGSEELDTVENGITLAADIHMDGEHPGVSVPTIRILRWDRNDLENGLVVERRKGIDDPWKQWPKAELWFYRRKLVEELKPISERIQGLHLIDGQVAADLYRLWKDDAYKALDLEAKSFKSYSESRGWDTGRALSLIYLYKRAQELQMEWPAKTTATDFRRALRNAGKIKAQAFYYVVFIPGVPKTPRILKTDSQDVVDELLDKEAGEVAARVGKWFGLHSKRGELRDRRLRKVEYDRR